MDQLHSVMAVNKEGDDGNAPLSEGGSVMSNFEQSECKDMLTDHPESNKENIPDINMDDNSVIELDSELEDEACSLWDMSANEEVANFLYEFKAPDIFLEIIEKTKSPRLVEIVIGILGNMLSFSGLCQNISRNELLLDSIISLCETSDSPTLIQLLRLILTALLNQTSKQFWFMSLSRNCFFMENIKFILENSLNAEILKGSFQLLYYIFDENNEASKEWGSDAYIKAIIVAGKQVLCAECYKALDEYFLLLNILCQQEENKKAIASEADELLPIFSSYFLKLGEMYSIPEVERVSGMASSFSTYALLLENESVNEHLKNIDQNIARSIHNLFFLTVKRIEETEKVGMITNQQKPLSDEICHSSEETKATCENLEMKNDECANWVTLNESIQYVAAILHKHSTEDNLKQLFLEIMSHDSYSFAH